MKRPYFQFYPGDWLSSTAVALMTPSERGGFIDLLSHSWASEDCGIPDDDAQLAVLSRLGPTWVKSSKRLRQQFEVSNGKLYNRKLLTVRQAAEDWSEKQREAGQRGAKKRWEKDGKPIGSPSKKNGNPMKKNMGSPSEKNGFSSSYSFIERSGGGGSNTSVFGKGPQPPPQNSSAAKNWTTDKTYLPLVSAWRQGHPDAIDGDFQKNHKYWLRMNPAQQKQAVENLLERKRLCMQTSSTLGYWLREDFERAVVEPPPPGKRARAAAAALNGNYTAPPLDPAEAARIKAETDRMLAEFETGGT